MRLMSFALTTHQIMDRSKTVTRRLGWRTLRPGQLVLAVDRCMGLARGEHPVPLAVLRVTSATREPLGAIAASIQSRARFQFYPAAALREPQREGFPDQSPKQFVAMFCQHMQCTPETEVTRIEFQYVPGGRFPVPGFCRVCGSTEEASCWDDADGPCWWVDERGLAVLGQTTLCSHCARQLARRASEGCPFDDCEALACASG